MLVFGLNVSCRIDQSLLYLLNMKIFMNVGASVILLLAVLQITHTIKVPGLFISALAFFMLVVYRVYKKKTVL